MAIDLTRAKPSSEDGSNLAAWLNISHELRTPAHAILGQTELLLSGAIGPLSTEMRASLGDIQKAGAILLAQIDQAIRLAEEIPRGEASSSELDQMTLLLKAAWRQSQFGFNGLERHRQSAEEVNPKNVPERWLRLLATLLLELGATQTPGAAHHDPSMGRNIDHRQTSYLQFGYPSPDRHDTSHYLGLIEATMMVTGGLMHGEPNRLTLSWPV